MNTEPSPKPTTSQLSLSGSSLGDSLRRLAGAIHSLGALDNEELNAASTRLSGQKSPAPFLREQQPLQELLSSLALRVEALHQARREILENREELRRAPLSTEPQRIRLDHITVVTKLSKVDYDIQNRRVSYNELLQQYRQEGVNWEDIVASHLRQQEALLRLKSLLPNARFISRDESRVAALDHSDLVIAFGGDDHFKHVSHSVTTGFMLGVNSDPATSVAALTSTTTSGLSSILRKLEDGVFMVEEWTRLETSVNGKPLSRAC